MAKNPAVRLPKSPKLDSLIAKACLHLFHPARVRRDAVRRATKPAMVVARRVPRWSANVPDGNTFTRSHQSRASLFAMLCGSGAWAQDAARTAGRSSHPIPLSLARSKTRLAPTQPTAPITAPGWRWSSWCLLATTCLGPITEVMSSIPSLHH